MIKYLKAVGREFRNIKWPTTKIAFYYSAAVILVSGLIAVYLGILDMSFIAIVEKFLI